MDSPNPLPVSGSGTVSDPFIVNANYGTTVELNPGEGGGGLWYYTAPGTTIPTLLPNTSRDLVLSNVTYANDGLYTCTGVDSFSLTVEAPSTPVPALPTWALIAIPILLITSARFLLNRRMA